MGTVLYINNSFCLSLDQLRSYFSVELVPETPLYEDLLIAQRDGELVKWLAEGGSEDEMKVLKDLENLPTDISNSELVNRLKKIFVGNAQKIQKPHFSNYIELQQVRCLVNDSIVNLKETVPCHFQGYFQKAKIDVAQQNKMKFLIDFKIIKVDNELFEINLSGTYLLSLKGKSIGQIVTIETNYSNLIANRTFSLIVDGESTGQITINSNEEIIKVGNQEIVMVYVEGGRFTMGATPEQVKDAYGDEKPTHYVTLSNFRISKYEVTQELWTTVMKNNPTRSDLVGAKRPVVNVSWEDCKEFIRKLNQLTNRNFRLPTEAEWEYAAREGKNRKYRYSGSNRIDDVAWYSGNSNTMVHPVGYQKQANELGLYDMSGNIYEWCQDWYEGHYSGEEQENPTGPKSGTYRVRRGGSWTRNERDCRVAFRGYLNPDKGDAETGLRLAL